MRFTSDDYGEGYWERAEGSNYFKYGDDPGWKGILHVINSNHPSGSKIIEAACSKGYFLRAALSDGHKALGFDISEWAISHSVARTAIQHDAIDPWPYPKEQADIVCSWEFLEHIHQVNLPAVLDNMMQVLRPGGEMWHKIGIVVPEDHDFAGQEDHDKTHVNVMYRAQWEFLFGSLGLEHQPRIEAQLDDAFKHRDWKGRFFVWKKPDEETNTTDHINPASVLG